MYDYSHSQPRSRNRSKKLFLLIILTIPLLAFVGWKALALDQPFTLSGTTERLLGALKKPSQPIDEAVLAAKLQPYLATYETRGWTIGIYVLDFKTGSTYSLNPDGLFEAASLTKVPVLLSLYEEAQEGKIKFDQKVEVLSADLRQFGTSVMPWRGQGTTYTYAELAWYMSNRSDNTAFQTLARVLGETNVDRNLYDWGFQTYNIANNVTSPRELARIFDLIYNCKIVKNHYCEEIKSLMVKTNEEDRIPKLLPQDVRVIHKTGNAVGALQDAGVVELKDRPYAIAILNKGVTDEALEEKIMSEISLEVYNYLKSLD